MSSVQKQSLGRWDRLAELEAAILGRIGDEASELQRIECLDEEQRAEIHTILEAMKHDGQSHLAIVRTIADEANSGGRQCLSV